MKILIPILLLLSCTEPSDTIEIGFSAAYVHDICMGSSPKEIVLQFDNGITRLPAKEVRTGVISTSTAKKEKGRCKLLKVSVINAQGNETSQFKDGFDSEWVVTTTGQVFKGENDFTVYGQLFCEGFDLKVGK
jgi:hypothetical protein